MNYEGSSFLNAGKQYHNFTIHWLTLLRFRVQAESSKNK